MDVIKSDINPNIRRKVDADSYDIPKRMGVSVKSEDQALAFETLRKDMGNRTAKKGNRKEGNQATFTYILKLAWRKYQEDVVSSQDEFDEVANSV